MNSKAMAIMGILTALAAGCGSDPTTDSTRDSAVDLPSGSGGSGMGGATGTGGATARDDGGATMTSTGGQGVGGSVGTGSGGSGGIRGSGGRTGTGGASSTTGGSPGTGGAGSGGHPADGGVDVGSPAIDGAQDAPADKPVPVPSDGATDAPACINQLISEAQAAPVGYPPMSYYQCTYQGQSVYYSPPQCCDQFSKLYAADCTVICAPDGGYTGRGDGRCPDFKQDTCTVLWQDYRTH